MQTHAIALATFEKLSQVFLDQLQDDHIHIFVHASEC